MHHDTCVTHVPWCMPGSLTCSFICSRWQGKRSRHSRRTGNPQFNVSGKRPMTFHLVRKCTCHWTNSNWGAFLQNRAVYCVLMESVIKQCITNLIWGWHRIAFLYGWIKHKASNISKGNVYYYTDDDFKYKKTVLKLMTTNIITFRPLINQRPILTMLHI